MLKIETHAEIAKRTGLGIREVMAEFNRQQAQARAGYEADVIANPDRYPAGVVESIRDHQA